MIGRQCGDRESLADRFYVLLNSSYLLGMRRTSLVLSEQSQRWEIVERVDRARVLAAWGA